MLVLALQFSKGSERGRTHGGFLTDLHCWGRHWQSQSCGALRGQRERELHAGRRGSEPNWVDSLKTEEKTKLVEPACQEDESCD
jgi:hypothetical protein